MRYISKNRVKRLKKRTPFKKIAHYGTCDVCHCWAPVATVPSINTRVRKYSCCEKCMNENLEPYNVCVDVAAYKNWNYMESWEKEKILTALPKFQKTKEEFFNDIAKRTNYYDTVVGGGRILYFESI